MWLVRMEVIPGSTVYKWRLASKGMPMASRVEEMVQMGLYITDVSMFLVKDIEK